MKKRGKWLLVLSIAAILIGSVALDQALAVTEDFKLTASDGSENDYLGYSLSVDEDVLVVGAFGDDDAGEDSGSAYVFRFDGTNWVEEAKITAPDAAAYDMFGHSVSVSGDVMVVGAYGDDDAGDNSGSAYVYRFDGTNWVQEAKLNASDGAEGDIYGYSVSVYEDVIVIGAWLDDDSTGSAYVYRFDGTNWIEEAKLIASDAWFEHYFGFSVSVNGELIVVGAIPEDDPGSTYTYRFDGTSWVEEQKIVASDGDMNDEFGNSVSVSRDVIVIGADLGPDYKGAAYVYRFDGANWVEEKKLITSDATGVPYFGESVSTNGYVIAVGTRSLESAYAYRFDGTDWIEDKLMLSDWTGCFQSSVSVGREVIAVGTRNAVYIYQIPCPAPEIAFGIINDKKAPQEDAFSINFNELTGLSDALADLDTKIVNIQVGPLALEIPGDLFIALPDRSYVYFSHNSDSNETFFIYFNPNGMATLNGAKTDLDVIANPIPLALEINGACWQSTTAWRKISSSQGVTYLQP